MNNDDDMSSEWTEKLCAKAVVDDYLSAALLVIQELHSAIASGRPVDPMYEPMVAQMLTAADFCAVHGILIDAWCKKTGGRTGE